MSWLVAFVTSIYGGVISYGGEPMLGMQFIIYGSVWICIGYLKETKRDENG